jgi:hypothetical protein
MTRSLTPAGLVVAKTWSPSGLYRGVGMLHGLAVP